MRWKEVFETGIKMGLDSDIRNIDDPGSYTGTYADCRIIYGDKDRDVRNLYVAVDAGVPEMVLVNELNKKGEKIDGIFMHHPTGEGVYRLTEVIEIQKYNWIRNGVNQVKAQRIYNDMVEEAAIGLKAGNHLAVGNAASFMDMPVMCMHTAIDNMVQGFFEGLAFSGDYVTVSDLFKRIKKLPECIMAEKNGDGPYFVGRESAGTGKIMVDMTGGMDPDSAIFRYIKKAGVKTLISMHYSKDNIKAIKKNRINAVITGHMASDSIGLNIFCDIMEKKGIKIITGSGFYRYKKISGSSPL